jgi:ATP-dependent DNA helicase RecQ
VLIGSGSEKVLRWRHNQLPDYGSGKERTRAQWTELARELVRQGYLRRVEDRFNVLDVTDKGRSVLEGRGRVALPEAVEMRTTSAPRVRLECDEELFERLRALRKRLADERNVAAFVIFSDVALRQMARDYPSNEREFSRISGVGVTKLREFGALFVNEIAEHLRSNPKVRFDDRAATGGFNRQNGHPRRLGDSPAWTLRRFRAGHTPEEIARERGFVLGTIMNHLALAAEAGEEIDLARLLSPEQQAEIEASFRAVSWQNITGVREKLDARYSYELLRLYRAVEPVRLCSSARPPAFICVHEPGRLAV